MRTVFAFTVRDLSRGKWSWIRVAITDKIVPGHHWQYAGIIRRDTYTVRGYGLVIQRCVRGAPYNTPRPGWGPQPPQS